MPLDQEKATYTRELPRLAAFENKFVVIHADQVIGTYDTYDDALQVGYQRCGLKPFLVKRIESVEHVHSFTRDIVPCLT